MKTVFLFLLFSICCFAQNSVSNDSICTKKIKLKNPILLDEKLVETSGLLFWDNRFWTHNDDTDTNLYALDPENGAVLETYNLPNVKNTDWEEISQDATHLYLGDFGNNANGNRSDLHILKIEKKSLLEHNPLIETIAFRYPNQTILNLKSRKNDFDCEAFVVDKDSIYLFTKEWISKKTTVYSLPKQAGNYIAIQKKNFEIHGLVTGATYLEDKKIVALCGYTKKGSPFVNLFYDFNGTDFFSGKNRKIKLKPRFHQIEGICTLDGLHYFVTNEQMKLALINRPQAMYQLDFSSFLKGDVMSKK
jgi:hypothetical protein